MDKHTLEQIKQIKITLRIINKRLESVQQNKIEGNPVGVTSAIDSAKWWTSHLLCELNTLTKMIG